MPEPHHRWRAHIRPRLVSLRLSPTREAEVVEELAQHLEERWRELVARGATAEDAAHTARTEFDGARLEALLGDLRQAHWAEIPPPGPSRAFSFDSLRIDVRHAIRALRATPSFTIGALLVLALGIGATTAIFSVVDAVALRPLPFPDPGRLVAVGVRANASVGGAAAQRSGPVGPGRGGAIPGAKPPDPDALASITAQDYLDWSDRQQVFDGMAALEGVGDYVFQPAGSDPKLVKADRVTSGFFDVLRVRSMLGTAFSSLVTGDDRIAVVSYDFWQRELGCDPAVVGRSVVLNGESHAIVGVMPKGFSYPPGSSLLADIWILWVPRVQDRAVGGSGPRSLGGHQSIARLKSDVSLVQAQAQMSRIADASTAVNPAPNSRRDIGIRPLRDHLIGTSTRAWMLMLLAAAGFVLLIVCANVANLWLARGTVQQRDVAVRAALGASRGRLVQRVLIESLVVSVTGTLVGLVLAWWLVRVLATALPDSLVRVAAIGIDARVIALAAVAALVTGLVSGFAPALQGSRTALADVLNERARGGSAGRGRRRARAALVVAEVAFAVVLLVGAALFIGSFINILRLDPGFRTDRVLVAQLGPGTAQADIRPALENLVDRARQWPGVIDAAAGGPGVPFRIQMQIGALQVPGEPIDYTKTVSVKFVTPGYYQTLAIPLRSGRYFTGDDRDGAENVVILSDATARLFFGDMDPVDRIVNVLGDTDRRIVGIVGNARQANLEVIPHPEIYLPMAQSRSKSYGYVLLHTSRDPNEVLPALRSAVSQVLPGTPLRNVARLEDLWAAQTAERRLSMLMFGLFGMLGLAISAVGIFGVIAYLVSQQTREIGIRMALGATRSRIVAGVIGHVGQLVSAGLVTGGLVAWTLSNAAGRFLFGLDPMDARAYAAAMITLVAASFVAVLLPVRRAASINPTDALRKE